MKRCLTRAARLGFWWSGPFVAAVSLPAALSLSLSTARADLAPQVEPGIANDRYDPSERGSDWFSAESLDLRGHGRFALGLTGSFAKKTLVIFDPAGNELVAPVQEQWALHVGAAVTLVDRVRLGASLPLVLATKGRQGELFGRSYAAEEGFAVGDLRLGLDVRLFGEHGAPITMAAGLQAHLPTGSRAAFVSDGEARFVPRILAAGDIGLFTWAARFGFDGRLRQDDFGGEPVGTELEAALAAGLRLADGAVVIGPEIFGSTTLTDGAAFAERGTPLEVLFGAHAKIAQSWQIAAGAGAGINRALGSPAFRVLASLGYVSPPPAPPLPPPPPAPPPPPPPPAPPPPPPPPPPDRDGDGIVDAEDACPDVAGERDPDPAKNGCPKVVVVDKEIKILERIEFEFGRAILRPESTPVLEGVLRALREHPEIKKVRVEGHTDNRGGEDFNLRLSQTRAETVVAWLTGQGIAPDRLEPRGYGERQPIDENRTDDGRQRNRRVQFMITDKAPQAETPTLEKADSAAKPDKPVLAP